MKKKSNNSVFLWGLSLTYYICNYAESYNINFVETTSLVS